MLAKIRKFSSSIYAKFFLVIIAIPFIFWGMGPLFTGGSQNTIVTIGKEKFLTDEFTNFIRYKTTKSSNVDENLIEDLFSAFIGEKIMELEINYFNLYISDNSLGSIIKNEKSFLKENKFSRTAYEKFLLTNNMTAYNFENNFSKLQKKRQLLDFIGKGLAPSKFLVNVSYNQINQNRQVEVINLKKYFETKINFTDKDIEDYYKKNEENFFEIYKNVNIIELSPKKLTSADEYNNLFFNLIDEIDDLTVQGENLNFIINKYNLGNADTYLIDKFGKDINSKLIESISEELNKEIFKIQEDGIVTLIEKNNKYFLIEFIKTENVKKEITQEKVKSKILSMMKNEAKRKINAELVTKINQNKFDKIDFDEFAKNENLKIEIITLKNLNDDKLLKKELVKEIYSFVGKKVILVNDMYLLENYLIYINKIINVSIDEDNKDYSGYTNLSKIKMTGEIYNTYDTYIKERYKIEINYKTLDTVKNYFN